MNEEFVATASIEIDASIRDVWNALVDPDVIEKYMFGATVVSDWKEGSSIMWKGEWEGTSYEDKGTLLRVDAPNILQYTHFSSLSGLADEPQNYHTVTIELKTQGRSTYITLRQDNNPTEEAKNHSESNWAAMLVSLKSLLEN